MRNVEFWIVTFEKNGNREMWREALTAAAAQSLARQLSIAGQRGRARRFVVPKSDLWAAISVAKSKLNVA